MTTINSLVNDLDSLLHNNEELQSLVAEITSELTDEQKAMDVESEIVDQLVTEASLKIESLLAEAAIFALLFE